MADTQFGLHHTTIQKFLNREVKLHPYKIFMNEENNDFDGRNRIKFAKYSPNEPEMA